ncbi:unnamed protein product [Moneuplotes crassus]|uniref:histidine kinase n=1 Tax=Euplotes crassus TaxID=5936 RepID=A0AAD1Y3B2_EUPCR|nr:unnamed protein product [Moneuplotes crassus]
MICIIVVLGLCSENSTIFVVRTVTLILLIIFLSFFQNIVEKYELAALYSGSIFSMLVVIAFTEINTTLGHFRLYEGFMTQISLSFLMSVCMSTNWILATLLLFISYLYYLARMMTTFDNIPHELVIAFCETCIFYALGTYLNSRTLQRELSSNYKAEASSKEFKNFLKCLPEGVSIVDHENFELKFFNSKLKKAFEIGLYCNQESKVKEFEKLKTQIDQEFNEVMQKDKENFLESPCENEPLQSLMKNFKIIDSSDIIKRNASSQEVSEYFESQRVQSQVLNLEQYSLISKTQKIGSSEDVNLVEFLKQERENLKNQKRRERESKIAVYFDPFNHMKGIEMIKREFVIKTRRVNTSSPDKSKPSMYLHIFSDTTQITQLEEQKAQNRYQKQMLANVSHEFRTPLNAMSLSLMLLRKKIRGPQAKLLRIASSSCDILSSLVEDILDHAKIESGMFETQQDIFQISKLLDEIKDIFELQTLNKSIQLIISIDEELKDSFLSTDKQRIKQVLMNLLSNALKFTDHGSIKVRVEKLHQQREYFEELEENKEDFKFFEEDTLQNGSVRSNDSSSEYSISQEFTSRPQVPRVEKYTINPDEKENYFRNFRANIPMQANLEEDDLSLFKPCRNIKLKLTVEDTGIGIPLSDQSSLFKLFGKTSSNHNRNKTGCGLGLTICRKILQKLGGDITLESQEGKGTKFTCIFECKY